MTSGRRGEVEAFSQFVLGGELVRRVASVLAPAGIAAMPLKGVLFQRLLYGDPLRRPISDVDVLVPHERYDDAVALLLAEGFRHRFTSHSMGALCLTSPEGMDLDLHRRLFGVGRYRMPSDEVFARASEDVRLFGAPVQLMSPLDTYSHAIGKFAADHCDRRHAERLREIALVASALHLQPDAAAEHLVRCGMRRAARYVLPLVAGEPPDPFAVDVLARLPPDPLGAGLAELAARLIPAGRPSGPAGTLPAHLLNHSLPRAAVALLAAAANRAGIVRPGAQR